MFYNLNMFKTDTSTAQKSAKLRFPKHENILVFFRITLNQKIIIFFLMQSYCV